MPSRSRRFKRIVCQQVPCVEFRCGRKSLLALPRRDSVAKHGYRGVPETTPNGAVLIKDEQRQHGHMLYLISAFVLQTDLWQL